jgi:N-methylhydantoinase B
MRAQISACRLGERRFLELVAKYGRDVVRACIERIWDENETLARRAVEAIPDGTYEASCRLDNDGITLDQPIPLRVKVIVSGSDMTVDFTGTSPQVQGPYNSKSAEAVARIAFKFFTTPDLPANAGAFRNLKVICPEGTVLSASGRAPMAWWNMPVNSSIDLILRALYGALPEGVTAGHSDNIGAAQLAGVHPRSGKPFQTFIPYTGAWGATARSDGESAIVSLIQGDVRLLPIELRENMFPIRIGEFAIREDSGGAGRYRGGLGVRISQQALTDCSYQAQYERTVDSPWGLAGGKPGKVTETWREREGKGEHQKLPFKCNDLPFKAGDVEVLLTAGGGGFGAAFERDPGRVRDDVVNGYVSVEAARREYGVVVDEKTLTVDAHATAALRDKNR